LAPLSGRPVVGYRLSVQFAVGAVMIPWDEQTVLAPFMLTDQGATGAITGAALPLFLSDPVGSGEALGEDLESMPPPVQALLTRRVPTILPPFSRKHRPVANVRYAWHEQVYEAGDRLLVQGQARRVPAAAGSMSLGSQHPLRQAPTQTQLFGTARRPLVLSDITLDATCSRLRAHDAHTFVPCRVVQVKRRPGRAADERRSGRQA
jgi:hypothetical protein